jgi:hypothetical protein
MTDEALALARDVERFLRVSTPVRVVDLPTPDGFAVGIAARALGTFRASLLLLEAGAVSEAMQLARSLFTDGLRMLELERLGPSRHSLLLGWELKAIAESEHLMAEAVRVGLEEDPGEAIDALAARRASVMRYAERNGLPVPKARDFPTEKALAERFDALHDYWNFRYAHQVVHGTLVVTGHRLSKAPDGTHLFETRTSGAEFADGTALFVARYVLLAFSGLLGVLAQPKPPGLAKLLDHIEEVSSRG